MTICAWCGKEFDVTSARRRVGRQYGAGAYDDSFPDGNVCDDCALTEIGGAVAIGEEIMEDMGWDDD